MRTFQEIYDLAIQRKGEEFIVDQLIDPLEKGQIVVIPDDRFLAEFTKVIFQAGFSWSVIEKKWPAFEEAFHGFDLNACAMMSDEEMDQIMSAKKVVANFGKIKSIRDNAAFLLGLVEQYGSVGSYFARWERGDYCLNLLYLKKHGARLGGKTASIALRRLGVDAFIFTDSVVKAMAREDIITKQPSSQKDMKAAQAALDQWHKESAKPLNHLSQILAYSVD